MDKASLAVVGSVTAALVGAIVGSLLNGYATRRLEARREVRDERRREAEIRGAARLVFTDLQVNRNSIESTLKRKGWPEIRFGLSDFATEAWATYGVRLAIGLSPRDYDVVAEACAKTSMTKSMFGPSTPIYPPPDEEEFDRSEIHENMRRLHDMIVKALEVLHPIAYGQRRFVDR